MKLYHGSNVIVSKPRILPPKLGHTLAKKGTRRNDRCNS